VPRREAASAEARQVAADILINLDAAGAVVGFDIDHASKPMDLRAVAVALPLPR
jgi:uncharacterized protein YuzE